MTEIKEDVVNISISEDDIVESISLLTDMLEFVKGDRGDGGREDLPDRDHDDGMV